MTYRSLATPRRRIAREFRNLVHEFRICRAEFKSDFNSAVAKQMDKLQELDDLEPSDKSRICVAVEDAARCYLSTQWGPFFGRAIKIRYRLQAAIGIITVPFLIGFFYLLPKPSFPYIAKSHVDSVYFGLNLLLFLAMLFWVSVGISLHSRLPYRYKTLVTIILTASAFGAVAVLQTRAVYIRSAWKSIIASLSPIHPWLRMQMASLPVAQVLQCTLFLIGIACTLTVVAKLISFCGRVAASGKAGGYSRPAVHSADIIINLLHISSLMTELMTPIQAASADVKEYSNKRSQITTPSWNATWNVINGLLGSLAYEIKGPWREAMRSYYGPAGERMASEAPRIALFIRYQQAKNCLLSDNLFKLRDAITSTLVHAADGNWHLIGAGEEYANEVIAQRRSRIIRRTIIIGLSIAGAIAAHFMRNTVVSITCGLFALEQFLKLLDPDAPTLLDMASKVANTLKRGG